MPSIGPLEIVFVLVIALLIFGPERLPEMARKVGRATNELRRMAAEVRSEFDVGLDDDDSPRRSSSARSATTVDDEQESEMDLGDDEDAGWDEPDEPDEEDAWDVGDEGKPPIAEGLEEAEESGPAPAAGAAVEDGAGSGEGQGSEEEQDSEETSEKPPRDTGARGSATSSGGS